MDDPFMYLSLDTLLNDFAKFFYRKGRASAMQHRVTVDTHRTQVSNGIKRVFSPDFPKRFYVMNMNKTLTERAEYSLE